MKNLLIISSILIFLAGCTASSFKSGIDAEAEGKNQEYWGRFYVECGDSYYGKTVGWSQLKDVTFSVSPEPLTDLDKENGYEWKGSGVIRFKRHRNRTFGEWGDWQSAGAQEVLLTKKGGKWSAVELLLSLGRCCKPPSCEEVAATEK